MLGSFALIIVVFYFLVIRPQNKKQRDAQKMLKSLRKGDRIVTIGGMRGSIVSVKEDVVVVKVDENTKLEFNKSAISQVLERKEGLPEARE
jgi:preprotein translocase subunit YajC